MQIMVIARNWLGSSKINPQAAKIFAVINKLTHITHEHTFFSLYPDFNSNPLDQCPTTNPEC